MCSLPFADSESVNIHLKFEIVYTYTCNQVKCTPVPDICQLYDHLYGADTILFSIRTCTPIFYVRQPFHELGVLYCADTIQFQNVNVYIYILCSSVL